MSIHSRAQALLEAHLYPDPLPLPLLLPLPLPPPPLLLPPRARVRIPKDHQLPST